MPEISLIVATLNRTLELHRLLESLTHQSFTDFEIIIVDQNKDERLNAVLQCAKYSKLIIRHLRHHPANLAAARNIGINVAKGKWYGFPDDDCWYEPHTLSQLNQRYEQNDMPHGVIGRWVEQDAEHHAAILSWKKSSQFRDLPVSSITLFLHKSIITRLGGFDIRLGVGQWFGAAEETDLVLRALKEQANIAYEPSLHVHHILNEVSIVGKSDYIRLSKNRARGTGALYAKHDLSTWVIVRGLLAPLLKPIIQGRLKYGLLEGWSLTQGRYQGWLQWSQFHQNKSDQDYLLTSHKDEQG